MKLNLGEGNWPIAGFLGVDRKTGQEVYPLSYPDGSAEVIRASHVLEHFSHRDTGKVLADWVRVLKPGGVLKVAVPNFETICRWYQEKRENIPLMAYVVGGQIDESDYHKTVFDEGFLLNCLQHAGLTDIKRWESETDDNASWEISLNLQGTKPEESSWPGNKAYNKYSQFGEDGILEAIFEKIGTTNKYCVDVGAADGLLFSNVRQFIEKGWDGLLIESDRERFTKLSQDSGGGQFGRGHIRCLNRMVEPVGMHSLDNLLDHAGAPVEFDLLSIDVDGQEYYIWNSLLRYKPRVVVIEYDPDADSMFVPPLGGDGQAGWNATTFVAAARGYTPLIRTQTNVICVRRDLLEPKIETEPKIEIQEPKAEPDRVEPVKIVAVISVPRLGFNANWHSTIRAMLALNIHVEMVEGVFWGQCMTRGIEKVIAQDAELILTIDYDTVFDVEHVVKLCQLIGDHPEYDAIVPVQVKRECNQMLFKMNGSNDFTGPLTPIAAGHFGLTIFDANAFNRLPKPWFNDQPARDGTWNDGRVDADMWFWEQFGRANLKAALANDVRIGHLELGITWANQEFRAVRQTVSDYRANGQPKECGGGLKLESL